MTKITDKNYFLPTIKALNGIELFTSGTTQPMLIRGVCSTTHLKSDYVVKYLNSPRMSVTSSCRELIAAFIAMELEMNVADPVLIEVSPEFVDTLRGKAGYKFAVNSIGINFGSKYFGQGFFELLRNQQLNDKQYEQAVNIFAFDVFISNADRNNNKQNMLTNGEKIMIFDHEMAFGFVMDIIKNPTPWIISESDRIWIKEHYFYPLLKENEPKFDNFVQRFDVINNNFWDIVNELIPMEWVPNQFEEIKHNLTGLVKNKSVLLQGLNKVLS